MLCVALRRYWLCLSSSYVLHHWHARCRAKPMDIPKEPTLEDGRRSWRHWVVLDHGCKYLHYSKMQRDVEICAACSLENGSLYEPRLG